MGEIQLWLKSSDQELIGKELIVSRDVVWRESHSPAAARLLLSDDELAEFLTPDGSIGGEVEFPANVQKITFYE